MGTGPGRLAGSWLLPSGGPSETHAGRGARASTAASVPGGAGCVCQCNASRQLGAGGGPWQQHAPSAPSASSAPSAPSAPPDPPPVPAPPPPAPAPPVAQRWIRHRHTHHTASLARSAQLPAGLHCIPGLPVALLADTVHVLPCLCSPVAPDVIPTSLARLSSPPSAAPRLDPPTRLHARRLTARLRPRTRLNPARPRRRPRALVGSSSADPGKRRLSAPNPSARALALPVGSAHRRLLCFSHLSLPLRHPAFVCRPGRARARRRKPRRDAHGDTQDDRLEGPCRQGWRRRRLGAEYLSDHGEPPSPGRPRCRLRRARTPSRSRAPGAKAERQR